MITNVTEREDGDTVRVTVSGEGGCLDDTVKPGTQPATPAPVSTSTPQQSAACNLGMIPDPTQGDVTLRFVNKSSYEAVVFWQDASQSPVQLVEYARLANSATVDQEAFQGDKWIIQDRASGATLLEYTASKEKKQCIVINRPVRTLWLEFVNQSGIPAIGYVVDANRNLKEHFVIGVGVTLGLWTGNGTPWRILDGSGNLLLDYTSTSAPDQRVVIPPLSASPPKIPLSTNTAAPTPTPTLAVKIPPIDPATNCPVIAGALSVVCYDVQGPTETELRASLDQLSPVLPNDARTERFVGWNWPGYGTNNCNLAAATVTLTELKVTMPRWAPPANASPQLVAKWKDFIQNISIWNQAYMDYIRDNYQKVIKSAIQNATCSTADAEAIKANDALTVSAGKYADQIQPAFAFP